jgi:hypothetical protein
MSARPPLMVVTPLTFLGGSFVVDPRAAADHLFSLPTQCLLSETVSGLFQAKFTKRLHSFNFVSARVNSSIVYNFNR